MSKKAKEERDDNRQLHSKMLIIQWGQTYEISYKLLMD